LTSLAYFTISLWQFGRAGHGEPAFDAVVGQALHGNRRDWQRNSGTGMRSSAWGRYQIGSPQCRAQWDSTGFDRNGVSRMPVKTRKRDKVNGPALLLR
jgi:hypothetical protein